MSTRIKSATLKEDDFEEPETVFQYHKIYQTLEERGVLTNFPFNIDLLSLAKLSFQIQQFIENNFGKSATNRDFNGFTKFSVHLFQDYSSDGPLLNILEQSLMFHKERNFTSLSVLQLTKNEYLPVLKKTESILIEVYSESRHFLP
jgi:hypothetical protein